MEINHIETQKLQVFAKLIQKRRIALFFSQSELAYNVNISTSEVSKLENGEDIRFSNFLKIVHYLDHDYTITENRLNLHFYNH